MQTRARFNERMLPRYLIALNLTFALAFKLRFFIKMQLSFSLLKTSYQFMTFSSNELVCCVEQVI